MVLWHMYHVSYVLLMYDVYIHALYIACSVYMLHCWCDMFVVWPRLTSGTMPNATSKRSWLLPRALKLQRRFPGVGCLMLFVVRRDPLGKENATQIICIDRSYRIFLIVMWCIYWQTYTTTNHQLYLSNRCIQWSGWLLSRENTMWVVCWGEGYVGWRDEQTVEEARLPRSWNCHETGY